MTLPDAAAAAGLIVLVGNQIVLIVEARRNRHETREVRDHVLSVKDELQNGNHKETP